MNIFYLDERPRVAAQYHCDKHVVKMILESAQILCTVANRYGIDTPYKPTHKNHPSVLWAGESKHHAEWLWRLLIELNCEYRYRFNKSDNHKSFDVIMNKLLLYSEIGLFAAMPDNGFTEPPQCMPPLFRIPGHTVAAYRNYYARDKRHLHAWTGREQPYWLHMYANS